MAAARTQVEQMESEEWVQLKKFLTLEHQLVCSCSAQELTGSSLSQERSPCVTMELCV